MAQIDFVRRFAGLICVRFEGFPMIWKYVCWDDYLSYKRRFERWWIQL